MTQALPHTTAGLAADLRALGLAAGDTVLVHSSYKSLGFVAGGPQAVVQALIDVVGTDGTVVVPTHVSDNSDPKEWQHPPVPEAWWPVIRSEVPGYDPLRTPSIQMGVIAETVRTWPGALRSTHPHVPFSALGARADEVTAHHRLDDMLGDDSPLGAVYRIGGKVLLLGVGHGSNTSLHLAEWRRPETPRAACGAAVRRDDGTAEWVTWTDATDSGDDFSALGEAFDAAGAIRIGRVGNAEARLMDQRTLVDFAAEWMTAHRT